MRISDWSSDVCSSDLEGGRREARADHDADRIIGSQPRRQDDRQNDENDGAEAEEPERVGQQQAKGDLEGAGQPRLGDGCGLGRRQHSFSLMRGSSAALTRSAMVVETTNKTVVNSTPPMSTGWFRWPTATENRKTKP